MTEKKTANKTTIQTMTTTKWQYSKPWEIICTTPLTKLSRSGMGQAQQNDKKEQRQKPQLPTLKNR